jgi:hypothetical protein
MDTITEFTASSMVGKEQTAEAMASGIPNNFRVTSVMMPRVPSEPTNKRVRSYPAADFRLRRAVCITRPSDKTTFNDMTVSRIVPYRTAVVPLARVDAIPPIEASAPGSTGKKRPVSLKYSLSCFRVTPACTVQSRSS